MSETAVRIRAAFRPTAARRGVCAPQLPTGASSETTAGTVPTEVPAAPVRNVGRTARMLALAYKVEAMVEAGEIKDYAEGARRLGITRARMTQVLALLNLARSIQEAILAGGHVLTERLLRPALREAAWEAQVELLRS